jgi:RNA polymerase-binding transcription factor DksA
MTMTTDDHATVVLQRRIPILRRRLLERRRELLVRVARTDDDLRWLDSNLESEWQEEAQEVTLARLLAALDELERSEIAAIDAALARIATNHSGRCSSCAGAIDDARLDVLPQVATCVRCAALHERHDGRHP